MATMLGLSHPASARRAVCMLATLPWLAACTFSETSARRTAVVAIPTAEGIALFEAGAPILFYRNQPEPGREAWRTNYVHPLYSVDGTVITEDAPQDHLHQRGVYWAWRRLLVDGVVVADGWVGDRFVLEVASPTPHPWPDGSMQIDAHATWRAPVNGVEAAIIEESSSIRAYPLADGHRRIDFEVRLRALRRGVQLAGTDDEKGYSGVSLRFARSDQLSFFSAGQSLEPQVGAVRTGEEVTFHWSSPAPGWPGSIRASCRVNNQAWHSWVLRREPSMQNCAYPGRNPVDVPQGRPLHIVVSLQL